MKTSGMSAKHYHHLLRKLRIVKSTEDPRRQYGCDDRQPFLGIAFVAAFLYFG